MVWLLISLGLIGATLKFCEWLQKAVEEGANRVLLDQLLSSDKEDEE